MPREPGLLRPPLAGEPARGCCIVAIALVAVGSLLPIIYDAFGEQFEELMDSGAHPEQFTQFGGGDIFSLTGSVALGFIHPFAVGLNLVFAVGFAAAAIAGERQRGTLEVLLARPDLAPTRRTARSRRDRAVRRA